MSDPTTESEKRSGGAEVKIKVNVDRDINIRITVAAAEDASAQEIELGRVIAEMNNAIVEKFANEGRAH